MEENNITDRWLSADTPIVSETGVIQMGEHDSIITSSNWRQILVDSEQAILAGRSDRGDHLYKILNDTFNESEQEDQEDLQAIDDGNGTVFLEEVQPEIKVEEFTIKQYLYGQVFDNLKETMDENQYWDYINSFFGPLEYDIQKDWIVVKYPDTRCSDPKGNSTPIYEPYVRIRYAGYTKTRMRVEVTRTKYTHSQYENGYIASHAHNGVSEWAGICTGSIFMQYENFSDYLFFVLNMFYTFWQTENASPIPLKNITNLRTGNVIHVSNIITDVRFLKTLKVGIQNIDGVIVPELKPTDASIKFLIDKGLVAYHVGDRWYSSLEFDTPSETKQRNPFMFKGVEIKENTIVSDSYLDPESIEKEPHLGYIEDTINRYKRVLISRVYYELKGENTTAPF